MLNQGLRRPYSLCRIVAAMKAVAACPDGKELRVDPSGRSTCTVYFNVLTVAAISPAAKAFETIMRPHELRLRTPQAFIPQVSARGPYCR